jgi:predicted kinase
MSSRCVGCGRFIPRETVTCCGFGHLVKKRPNLIVLCGPSHCGKSTLAKSLPGQVISSDQIRSVLGLGFSRDDSRFWTIFDDSKRLALKLGRDVILDACHLSKRSRWHSVQNAEGYYKILVVFDIKPSILLARARKERRVPLSEVRRMTRAFDRPTLDEAEELGFDQVLVIEHKEVRRKPRLPKPMVKLHKEVSKCTFRKEAVEWR